jgi:hypothetical protein
MYFQSGLQLTEYIRPRFFPVLQPSSPLARFSGKLVMLSYPWFQAGFWDYQFHFPERPDGVLGNPMQFCGRDHLLRIKRMKLKFGQALEIVNSFFNINKPPSLSFKIHNSRLDPISPAVKLMTALAFSNHPDRSLKYMTHY